MRCLRMVNFAVAGVLLLSAGSALAGKPVPISECGTPILDPGKYVVTQDLFCLPNQQGIVVLSSDVTVDLKGHTITCDAENSFDRLVGAVLVGTFFDPEFVLDNVWVKNGTVSGCHDGVIFFWTGSGKISKITTTDNVDGGITLVGASNTRITKNTGMGDYVAIRTFDGHNNLIKSNSTIGTLDTGIWIAGDNGSTVKCNRSEWDLFGIAVGPFSEGNLVSGNFVSNAAGGITMFGIGNEEVPFVPGPFDTTIKHNLVQGSWFADLLEVMFVPPFFDAIVPDYLECQNSWMKNDYVSAWGPTNCIAPPVVLDEDDVCALDDDDDSDSDSDSDSD